MTNEVAKTESVNIVPVQGIFAPEPTYALISLIGPAGTPFYANINPVQSGLTITNSTINSSTVGLTSPAAAAFTTASVQTSPVANTDVANKQYVDGMVAGITWKSAARAATTVDLPALSGLLTVDTVALVAGDRVLVKNQSTASQNGIYVVASGAWSRSDDANTWDEFVGAVIFIEAGSQSGLAWYCTAQPGGTLGSTAINWSNLSVSATYSAGTGLSLIGNQFSITNTGVAAATYGSAAAVPVVSVNAQGQITSVVNTNIAINGNQITSGTVGSSYISGNYSGITGVGTLTSGVWNAGTIGVSYGGTGATTLTGYVKGNGTSAMTASATIPNTDITGLGTMSTQNANSVAITGGSGAFSTLKTLGLTGYLKGNDTSAVTASTTIPSSDISGLGTMAVQNANSVAITGGYATGLTNLGSDYLQLNTSAGATYAYGKLYWGTTGTLNVGLNGNSNLVMPVGDVVYVYGKASANITIGQVVIKTGVVGASGVITFGPSTAGITDGNAIVGIACEDITSGSFGRVTSHGVVRGFNLSAYNNNDTLWYDPAGGGALTATKPSAPNLKAEVGIVINNGSGGSGSMYVSLFPGSQLGGTDQNVQITGTPSDGSLLQYYAAGQYWRNVANSTVAVGTATNLAGGAAASIPYQSAAGTTAFLASAAGDSGKVLQSNGTSAPSWVTPTSYATVTDDTTTNATRYILFANVTSGNLTTEYVSSTKLKYNPSTGALTASQLIIAP
jgi:hypothetical protein